MLMPKAIKNIYTIQFTRLQDLSKKQEIANQYANIFQKNRL